MSERFGLDSERAVDDAVVAARDALARGELVVVPTDTVYGLAADAFEPGAVDRLRAAKGRGRDMPPPVLVASPTTLDALATSVPVYLRDVVEAFWPGPLTVVCRQQPSLTWDLGDARDTVAVRVPDHPVLLALLKQTGPLAVSSANLTGQPPATDVDDAEEMLGEAVAVYLDDGPADGGPASTILDVTSDPPRVLRVGAVSVEELRVHHPGILAPGEEPEQGWAAGQDTPDRDTAERDTAGRDTAGRDTAGEGVSGPAAAASDPDEGADDVLDDDDDVENPEFDTDAEPDEDDADDADDEDLDADRPLPGVSQISDDPPAPDPDARDR